ACSSNSSDPAPVMPGSGPQLSAPRPPADKLELKKPVERALKATEVHRYRMELPAGQVARGVVMQKGIDVALVTYDPSGKKIGDYDSPNRAHGPEPFLIEAPIAAAYDLAVKPFVEPGATGSAGEARYEA